MLPNPSTFAKEHEGHVSIADFLGGVCRPLNPQAVKSVAVLFDAHVSISEFGSTSTLTKLVAKNKMPSCTLPVCSPRDCKARHHRRQHGRWLCERPEGHLLREAGPHQRRTEALQWASSRASTQAWTVDSQEGPTTGTKSGAGVHVRRHVLEDKGDKQGQKLPRSTSNQWSPENDELAEGIRYINAHAPESDGLNEQTYWILTNIKAESGSRLLVGRKSKYMLCARTSLVVSQGPYRRANFP